MLRVFEPQGDEKVTLPLTFFTVMINIAGLLPLTFCEAGVTCICPLLPEVAVIVPAPLNCVRLTSTLAAPLLRIVNCSGDAESEHHPGVGLGYGVGLVVGPGEATGVGVGVEFGWQFTPWFPQGVGVGNGEITGVGDAEGSGVGVGEAGGNGEPGVGPGSGIVGAP